MSGSREEDAPFLSLAGAAAPLPRVQRKTDKPWVLLVGLACVLIAIIDMGAFLAEAPRTRVYEANICLAHYRDLDPTAISPDGTVPEKLCKVDAVQQRLAAIFGWQDMFDAIPSIFLAIPFGTLADKVGRKWIFTASLIGLELSSAWVLMICYFTSLPLQLTWLSAAFYFIGGGPIVASAIGITMISDIAPPEKRTTIFLYLTASVLIAEIIAPIMSARLMESGDWFPLVLSLAIQLAGTVLAVFFPETLHLRDAPALINRERESIEMDTLSAKDNFRLKHQLRHFRAAYHFLKSDWTLAMVVLTFMANRLGRQAMSLLVRYASKRYSWEIKKAAYLLSLRAATNLVAVAVFIPLVNFVLLRYLRLPSQWADLWLARGSVVLTTISFIFIGIASYPAMLILGLLIFNLGTGYNAAMRSVSIHVVGGQASSDIGKLMSTIAIVESMGAMVAGPLLNQMFQWGMDMGSAWLGLPFLASVFVFVAVAVITFVIDVDGKNEAYDKNIEYAEVQSEDGDGFEEVQGRSSALESDGARPYNLI